MGSKIRKFEVTVFCECFIIVLVLLFPREVTNHFILFFLTRDDLSLWVSDHFLIREVTSICEGLIREMTDYCQCFTIA